MYKDLTKQDILKKFAKNTSIYSISQVVARGGGFLISLLLWKFLTVEELGVITISQMVSLFLLPVLTFGFGDMIQKFYYEWDEVSRKKLLGAAYTFHGVFSLTVCIVICLLLSQWSQLIIHKVPFYPYVFICLLSSFFLNFSTLPISVLRIEENLKVYTWMVLANFITEMLFVVIAVFFLKKGVIGYLMAVALNNFVWSIPYYWVIHKKMFINFEWKLLKEPIRFSYPISAASYLDGFFAIIERYFLDKFFTLQQIGLVNVAQTFGGAYNQLNGIMKSSYVPFLYRMSLDREDAPRILAKYSAYYISVTGVVAVWAMLFCSDILMFIDKKFYDVITLVPWFIFAYYIFSVITAYGRGIDLSKKSHYNIWGAVVNLGTAIPAYAFFLQQYGTWGLVYASLFVSIVRCLYYMIIGHKCYPRPFYKLKFITINASVLLVALITIVFSGSFDQMHIVQKILIKIFLALVMSVAILVFGFLDRNTLKKVITRGA